MNHYDAQEIMRRHRAGLPIGYGTVTEAEAFLNREQKPVKAAPVVKPVVIQQRFDPTMDTLCVCGMRYGQHRVGTFACQNPRWEPGNGQPQWLKAVFRRAGTHQQTESAPVLGR